MWLVFPQGPLKILSPKNNYLALRRSEGRWRVDNHDKVIVELNSAINIRRDSDGSVIIQDNSKLCCLSIKEMLRKREGRKSLGKIT